MKEVVRGGLGPSDQLRASGFLEGALAEKEEAGKGRGSRRINSHQDFDGCTCLGQILPPSAVLQSY